MTTPGLVLSSAPRSAAPCWWPGVGSEAIELFERGHAIAKKDGTEAYLLRCLAPLAEATRSPAVLAEADRLLAGARLPAGDAVGAGV